MNLNPIERHRLGSLQPALQQDAWEFLSACEKASVLPDGTRVYISDGSRSFGEQAALYSLGRTQAGKIVTFARPGRSLHNFGLAFDIALFNGKALQWDGIPEAVGECGEMHGLSWGGRWVDARRDENHFQLAAISLAEARLTWPEGWAA
jgi:peptidoglycan L-alanyl-D-glutamate endopeptidase CwlK